MRCALAGSMLVVLALSGVARAGGEADRQFAFAARLMQDGQADLAAEAFDDFLRDYPTDARVGDAWYYRALLALQLKQPKDARNHLANANKPLRVPPSRIALLRGQFLLEDDRPVDAVTQLEAVQPKELGDDAARATWHYLLGAAYRGANNPEAAGRQFDLASESKSPVYARAQLELGKTRLLLKQNAEALEALAQLASGKVDADVAAEAASLAAPLAYRLKQYEQAVALYRRLLDHHPASAFAGDARLGVLRALVAAGKHEQVLTEHAAMAHRLSPAEVAEGLYLKAAAQVQLKRYAQAITTLDQFARQAKADQPLRDDAVYLAGLCRYHTDAKAYAAWYDQVRPAGGQLAYLRAVAAERADDDRTALGIYSKLITANDATYTSKALLARARLYEKQSQPEAAAADLQAFASRYGADARAIDAQRKAISLALAAGRHDQSRELAEQWLAANPGHDDADAVKLQLAAALMKLKQRAKAERVLDAVLAGKPDKEFEAPARFYRGALLAGDARPNDPKSAAAAIGELTRAEQLGLPPAQRVQSLALRARLHRLAGEQAKALAAYEQLRVADPDGRYAPATAVWIGTGLIDRQQYEAAIAWLQRAADAKDADARTTAAARFHLARGYQLAGRHDEAVEAYRRQLATTEGFGEQGRLGLAGALAAQGKLDEALEEYNGLVRAEGSQVAATALYESASLHLKQAASLANAGADDQATPHRQEARRRLNRLIILHDVPQLQPLADRARVLLARTEMSLGMRDPAVRRLTEMVQRPNGAWAQVAGAELLLIEGRTADARVLLKQTAQGDDAQALAAGKRLAELGPTP